MNNLSEKMQQRLDAWRKNTIQVPSAEKVRAKPAVRFSGKKDYGDVENLDDWEEETKRSQRRK